jgi:hypothetical protein
LPRAYRKLDPKRWAVGASAGSILLLAAVFALVRTGRGVVRGIDQKQQAEAAKDDVSVRIAPGEVLVEEFVLERSEGYSMTVHPYDGACKAAFAQVGSAVERPSRDEILKILRARALEIDKGASRLLEGTTGAGRHAWAVWHDLPKPNRVLVVYSDTRGRR